MLRLTCPCILRVLYLTYVAGENLDLLAWIKGCTLIITSSALPTDVAMSNALLKNHRETLADIETQNSRWV